MPNATGSGGPRRGPSQLALLFHIRKTVALTGAVLRDARVHWFSKLLFVSSIGALLLALLFPEMAADLLAFVGLPGIGAMLDILGLPVDAGLDWVAFSVAAFNLLRLFPAEIVGEHYDRLFRSNKMAS